MRISVDNVRRRDRDALKPFSCFAAGEDRDPHDERPNPAGDQQLRGVKAKPLSDIRIEHSRHAHPHQHIQRPTGPHDQRAGERRF